MTIFVYMWPFFNSIEQILFHIKAGIQHCEKENVKKENRGLIGLNENLSVNIKTLMHLHWLDYWLVQIKQNLFD